MMSVMVSMVIRVTSITEAMIMMLIPMLMRNDVFKLFAIDVTNIVMFLWHVGNSKDIFVPLYDLKQVAHYEFRKSQSRAVEILV